MRPWGRGCPRGADFYFGEGIWIDPYFLNVIYLLNLVNTFPNKFLGEFYLFKLICKESDDYLWDPNIRTQPLCVLLLIFKLHNSNADRKIQCCTII